MKHEERARRAEKAKELLDNPYLSECFEDVREGLVKALEGCKWNDTATQTNLMLSLQLLKGVRTLMESHIRDGKVSAAEVERLNNPKVKRVA